MLGRYRGGDLGERGGELRSGRCWTLLCDDFDLKRSRLQCFQQRADSMRGRSYHSKLGYIV